jgi:hypothetical protein
MTDEQILEHIGLTAEQLRSLFEKFNAFLDSLTPEEQRALLHSLKSEKEAAAELGPDVTSEQLETLLKKYAPPHGRVCFICKILPAHGHR